MPPKPLAAKPTLRYVTSHRRHPPTSLKDLAFMLEIELTFGHRDDFDRRLRYALNDAFRQGLRRGGLSS